MTALVVSTETGAESMGGRGSRGSGGQHQWICNPRIDNMSEKNLLFSVESFDRGCWYFSMSPFVPPDFGSFGLL